MASISLHLDGDVKISNYNPAYPVISVDLESFCGEEAWRFTLSKDQIMLHGADSDIRKFANGLLAAVDRATTPQPVAALLDQAEDLIHEAELAASHDIFL